MTNPKQADEKEHTLGWFTALLERGNAYLNGFIFVQTHL